MQLLRDEREIRQVIQTCGRGSDRKDFDLMRSAYHNDAYDDHGVFKGKVDDFIEWARPHHEKFEASMHLLGFPNVNVNGSSASAETYCILYQWLKPVAGDEPMPGQTVTIACRYVDRFEKRDGRWKIARRVVVYEGVMRAFRQENAPGPIGNGFTVGLRSHDDVVFAMEADI
nr:nuclear transport factor 2 family protein [Chelatococcus sp. YT9]